MSITLIAAMDRNRVIGIDNKLPWRLPAEMAYFTKMTTGKTVLMGRKTCESLPKPLINRRNVVLTRQRDLAAEGYEYVHSLEEAAKLGDSADLMVMGGAEIYKQLLPYADTVLLTEVHTTVEAGDAFFPELPEAEWELAESNFRANDEKNKFDFTTQVFKRKQ